MEENFDLLNATPESDPNIKKSIDFGHMDNDSTILINGENLEALLSSWTGWYRHPRGGTYTICKDGDGYLVKKPGGGTDAWGTGYTWREVKKGYGLDGVSWYQERRGTSCR